MPPSDLYICLKSFDKICHHSADHRLYSITATSFLKQFLQLDDSVRFCNKTLLLK